MTDTITPAQSQAESTATEPPHITRPETDAAAVRAVADHETLIARHEMARQQLGILKGQDRVLAMPGG